jgi:hypothetical protein
MKKILQRLLVFVLITVGFTALFHIVMVFRKDSVDFMSNQSNVLITSFIILLQFGLVPVIMHYYASTNIFLRWSSKVFIFNAFMALLHHLHFTVYPQNLYIKYGIWVSYVVVIFTTTWLTIMAIESFRHKLMPNLIGRLLGWIAFITIISYSLLKWFFVMLVAASFITQNQMDIFMDGLLYVTFMMHVILLVFTYYIREDDRKYKRKVVKMTIFRGASSE